MSSPRPEYPYDIFISYRHNDNLPDRHTGRSGWVTEFVKSLQEELTATIKEPVSIYFDSNPHDGLSEHHDVDLSLREKVKALILIPVISQTYCDANGFAWKNEFLPFRDLVSTDHVGLKVKVANGNVASRILPVRIHELDDRDLNILEHALDGKLRAIDFTFKAPGVNRPLARKDAQQENFRNLSYSDQINKVANAIKEILDVLKSDEAFHGFSQRNTDRLPRLRNDVPVPAATLFGRDKELQELHELLNQKRVISILGAGGMGKTSLALEVAHRVKDLFSGNVVFAPMADITTAEEVIPALANAIGIKDAEGRNLVKGISAAIGDLKALIVLDNLEQVIGVAPQIADLISNCPNLRILATSRMPLKIRAEYEYTLSPLPLPAGQHLKSVEHLLEFPSIQLFVDRATKVNGTFRLTPENAAEVVQICQRLDGLPLALELAAARIRMMSAKQLLQRLEHVLDVLTSGAKDLPERHQTLRATIDWSFSMLTGPEKALFRRMSVFSGGCTPEAIEEVCYEKNSTQAFDELESLVDKGLVHRSGSADRFMMLQTIREYAIERLGEVNETDTVRYRQAKYFERIATQIREGLENGHQADWIQRCTLEEANLQSVLDFLMSEARGGNAEAMEIGMTICGQLYFYWHIQGKHIVARQYSNAFLGLPNCPASGRSKALCLNTVGLASSTLGHNEQSVKEHQAAYDIAALVKDRPTMGFAKLSMFIAYLGIGKIAEAEACASEYFQISMESGSDFERGFAHTATGIMHLVKGELDAAKTFYDQALEIQNKIPDLEGGGLSRGGLALLSSLRGNYAESIELYGASLKSFATMGDRAEEARILEEMAWVYLKSENAKEARKAFLDSIHAYEDVGSVRGIGLALLGIASVEAVENHPAKAIEIETAAILFAEQEGVVNNYGEGFQGAVYLEGARKQLSKSELDLAIGFGKKLSLKDTLQMASGVQN